MPPSADEAGQQESLLNLDPVFQEGSGARKKSPKEKKKKKKDGSLAEEDAARADKGDDGTEAELDGKMYVPDIYIFSRTPSTYKSIRNITVLTLVY